MLSALRCGKRYGQYHSPCCQVLAHGKGALVLVGDVTDALNAETVVAIVLLCGDRKAVFKAERCGTVVINLDGNNPAFLRNVQADDAVILLLLADRLDGIVQSVSEQGVQVRRL